MFCLRYDHQTEKETPVSTVLPYDQNPSKYTVVYAFDPKPNLAFTGSNQAYRTISTSQLNVLLRLHLWPIDVVVYYGSQGYLVLRGASRLDAFSGYPFRS